MEVRYAGTLTRNASNTVVTVACAAKVSGRAGERIVSFEANVGGLLLTAELREQPDFVDYFEGTWTLGGRATVCRFRVFGSERSLALVGRQDRRETDATSLWVLELDVASEAAA